jgi:hypothetical protein
MIDFLPNIYKMGWGWDFFWKTLDSSKLLGFLIPIMWFLPKITDIHTENNMITC